jgi:hypothetical protein
MRALSNGAIDFWSGPNTTLGTLLAQSAAGFLQEHHYTYIGIDFKLHASLGLVRLFIENDEVDEFNVDTTNIWTSGQWALLYFRGRGWTDDIIYGDTDASDPENVTIAYPGDTHVEAQVALTDAVGGVATHREWTPSTGTDHGALVDEVPPDIADYLESGTIGNRETFKFADILPLTGDVFAVKTMPYMVKTESGGRTFKTLVRSGGSDEANASAQGVSITTPAYYSDIYGSNPISGDPWTPTTVNAAELGVQIAG